MLRLTSKTLKPRAGEEKGGPTASEGDRCGGCDSEP